jgi:hypothetical protein
VDQQWQAARDDFLVPVKALSGIFRARFRDALRPTDSFADVPTAVWAQDWVVHCKAVGNGTTAFKYLAPYIFRVAISNNRILKVEDDHITFRYRASDTGQLRHCTLTAQEFIRRFLQHVLPKHFVKVRYYGFLSPSQRGQLTVIRQQLSDAASTHAVPKHAATDTRMIEPAAAAGVDEAALSLPPHADSRSATRVTEVPTPAALDTSMTSPAATGVDVAVQTVLTNSLSAETTTLHEVRCPACGRLLHRRSILLPTRGPPS